MGGQVKQSSATLACVYVHCVLLIILCVFNFTLLGNGLPVNPGYGIALIILSTIAATLGVTAQAPADTLLRSFLLCISVLWSAVGVYHVTESFRPTGTTDSEALWAGYCAFLLISLFFVFGSLYHRAKFTAVLALGYTLAFIFEISSLWRPLRTSVGAYYLLMSALALYAVLSIVHTKFRKGEYALTASSAQHNREISRDYVPLGHAMNTVAFAILAGHVTGVYQSAAQAFMWVLVAGAYQLLAAVVAVRRSDTYNGFYFFLHSMLWLSLGFNLCLEYVTGVPPPPLLAVTIIFFVTFFCIALASLFSQVYQFLHNSALCVLVVALHVSGTRGAFLGAMGWILLVISLYGLAAHISRAQSSTFKLPLGMRLLEGARFKRFLERSCKCCVRCLYGRLVDGSVTGRRKALFQEDFILGFSKYYDLDVVGFASNAVAVMAILWIPQGPWVLPWAVAFGGLTQFIVGSVCFSRGLTFESCSFFTFGALYMIWGPARGLGLLAQDNGPAIIVGCVGFLCIGLLQLLLSFTVSKLWSLLIFFHILLVIGFLLHALAIPAFFVYQIVIGALFVLVCLYCFVSTATKTVVGRDLLPFGAPFLQVSFLHSQGPRALWADARRATGVKAIADIMNKGGICGIPTDVVYVLVAAVKFPEAVKRSYNTKKGADDRPMSMWISRTQQLAEGRELFGELVWAFMNEIWPSTVSCVLPKGQWLDNLGIADANPLVGRPDSIAVRMPDNCVTNYLVDQTGPIAVSSANPTGEADTTHHLQVLAKLGMENVDGILCSGPSPENMASTVVDTRRMTQGQLSFFRIGVVPRARVESVFEMVRTRFNNEGPTLPPSIPVSSEGQVNPAFSDDDDTSDSGVSGGGLCSTASHDESNASEGADDKPLVAQNAARLPPSLDLSQGTSGHGQHSQGISGHENPTYDSSEYGLYGGSDVSTNGPRSFSDYDRQSSALRGHPRASSPSSDVESESGPYEAMVVLPSGSMQVRNAKQISGKNPKQSKNEDHFRLNPLYNDTSEN